MIVNMSIQKNTPSNQRCVFKSYLLRKILVFLTVRPIGIYRSFTIEIKFWIIPFFIITVTPITIINVATALTIKG